MFDYRYRAITSKTRNIDLLELLSLGFSTSFWNWCNITVNVLILYGFVYRPSVNNCLVFPERIKPFTMMLLSIWKCDIFMCKVKTKVSICNQPLKWIKRQIGSKSSTLYPEFACTLYMCVKVYQGTRNLSNNPFSPGIPFLYPLKTSEDLWFSEGFRGYRNGTLAAILG